MGGKRHGYGGTPVYKLWCDINKRCNCKNYKRFRDYGGRGISVCQEWRSAKAFCDWALKNGYKTGLQIDRIDNDGNYEPSNCQFITLQENCMVGKKRKYLNNTSSYVGVSYQKNDMVYKASIGVNNKQIYLGVYKTLEEALNARTLKEIELFGKQITNVVDKVNPRIEVKLIET